MPKTLLDSRNLSALAARAAAERGEATGFLVPVPDGGFRPVTYRAWFGEVTRLAAGLRNAGVRPRDRVLLMMETRYEWLVCDLAILSCGAWTVPVYPNLPPAQLGHPIADSGSRVAIVSRPELAARVLQAPGGRERLSALFLLDGPLAGDPGMPVHAVRPLLEEPAAPSAEELDALRVLRESIHPGDPATILYTSGTSSTPKGVVLSHGAILANGRSIEATFAFSDEDRYLSFLPLAHTFERTVTYSLLAAGVKIAYGHGTEAVARDAAEIRPTVMVGVPRLFERILASARERATARGPLVARIFRAAEAAAVRSGRRHGPVPRRPSGLRRFVPRACDLRWEYGFFGPLRRRFGGCLRYIVSGSAPLATRENLFFCGAGFPMLEGYGLTEAGPVVSVNTLDAWKPGSVGRVLRGGEVEARIAEDGEILVRSPSVMIGYWNLETETREALDCGWLHTGDLGVIDADGFIMITGRKKDMIVTSGGKNISPQPIEDLLRESPYIQEAIVFGDQRPYLVALLVPNRDAIERDHGLSVARDPERARDLHALLRSEILRATSDLAPHERIRRFDTLDTPPTIEAGTLTPTLKVRRTALAREHATRISALYESHLDAR